MTIDAELLNSRLQHVYWIGGGSGAGKSAIARRLAARYSMQLYPTDDAMLDHVRRCDPKDSPCLTAFQQMDIDERWVNRSPEAMLETFHWFRGEGFGLILEDLLKLPARERIIVEGFRLLPKLVKPLLRQPNQGIWLIPTPQFRLSAFEPRSVAQPPLLSREPLKLDRDGGAYSPVEAAIKLALCGASQLRGT
jgi:hypothetical protein